MRTTLSQLRYRTVSISGALLCTRNVTKFYAPRFSTKLCAHTFNRVSRGRCFYSQRDLLCHFSVRDVPCESVSLTPRPTVWQKLSIKCLMLTCFTKRCLDISLNMEWNNRDEHVQWKDFAAARINDPLLGVARACVIAVAIAVNYILPSTGWTKNRIYKEGKFSWY